MNRLLIAIGMFLTIATAVLAEKVPEDGIISQETLVMAQKAYARIVKLIEVGQANRFEALMARKHLLELKFHQNPDDSASYKALAQNTIDRIAVLQVLVSRGMVSKMEMQLTIEEKEMRARHAKAFLKEAELSVKAGQISSVGLQTIREACAILGISR